MELWCDFTTLKQPNEFNALAANQISPGTNQVTHMSQCTPLTSTLLLLACCWSCLVAAALAAAPPSPILVAAARAAPCSDIADRGQQQPRVYGFSVSADQKSFRAYDWSLLNGVGWATDPDQIEFAHSRGAQVELQAQGGVAEILSSRNSRRRWVSGWMNIISALNAH